MTLSSTHHQRSAPRERGAVLILALLSLMLLAAAVFYIFNVGTHLQRRTETQNAADAAVGAGAGWVARSMNLVAMNNVEITKLLAQVQIFDAIPAAVENSLADHTAAMDGVASHFNDQTLNSDHPGLLQGLGEVHAELVSHVSMLRDVNTRLNERRYDIAELTHYDLGGGRHGQLWEAMAALDAMSLASMENLGPIAQRSAVFAAAENQGGDQPRGFLLPFVPTLPWERGTYTDFRRPFESGLLPVEIDDEEFARGPFDTVFGWWAPVLEIKAEDIKQIAYEKDLDQDYGVPGFDRPTERAEKGEVTGYRPRGPMEFYTNQLEPAEDRAFGKSSQRGGVRSWFAERARAHAYAKAGLLFGDTPRGVYADAAWDGSYANFEGRVNSAQQAGSGGLPDVLFVFLEFEPVLASEAGQETMILEDWGFWPNEPGSSSAYGAFTTEEVGDNIWRLERRLSDTDPTNGTQRDYVQYVYLVWCAASSQEGSDSMRNPNNFPADIDEDELPAPIQLIEDELPHDDPVKRSQYLRFFAAADQSAKARLWPELFDGEGDNERPRQRVTATASATVFNTHSWDLWTQMWHAQLVPVGDLQPWVDYMFDEGRVTDEIPELNGDEVGATYNYLKAIAPLLEIVSEPTEVVSDEQ